MRLPWWLSSSMAWSRCEPSSAWSVRSSASISPCVDSIPDSRSCMSLRASPDDSSARASLSLCPAILSPGVNQGSGASEPDGRAVVGGNPRVEARLLSCRGFREPDPQAGDGA